MTVACKNSVDLFGSVFGSSRGLSERMLDDLSPEEIVWSQDTSPAMTERAKKVMNKLLDADDAYVPAAILLNQTVATYLKDEEDFETFSQFPYILQMAKVLTEAGYKNRVASFHDDIERTLQICGLNYDPNTCIDTIRKGLHASGIRELCWRAYRKSFSMEQDFGQALYASESAGIKASSLAPLLASNSDDVLLNFGFSKPAEIPFAEKDWHDIIIALCNSGYFGSAKHFRNLVLDRYHKPYQQA